MWVTIGSLGLAAPAAGGSIYRYIDDQGVLHFSDIPVDDRYNRVKRVYQEGPVISPRPAARIPSERDYDRLIVKIATRHRVRPGLVKAVIAAESNFKPNAVSRVGAQGLMQLMPATAESLGVDRPFGVIENMDGGVRYLRAMLDRYGDLTRAIAAYNAGPTAVDRYRGVPPYRETQAYVKRVLEYYRGYRNEFERADWRDDGPARRALGASQGKARAGNASSRTRGRIEGQREGRTVGRERAGRPSREAPRVEELARAEERLRAAGMLRTEEMASRGPVPAAPGAREPGFGKPTGRKSDR